MKLVTLVLSDAVVDIGWPDNSQSKQSEAVQKQFECQEFPLTVLHVRDFNCACVCD